jgi:hypothetical protein
LTRELADLSRGEGAGADITTVIVPQKEGALTIIRCPFCAVKPFTSQIKLRCEPLLFNLMPVHGE